MPDPRRDQDEVWAWLLGVLCGAIAALLGGLYIWATGGMR